MTYSIPSAEPDQKGKTQDRWEIGCKGLNGFSGNIASISVHYRHEESGQSERDPQVKISEQADRQTKGRHALEVTAGLNQLSKPQSSGRPLAAGQTL